MERGRTAWLNMVQSDESLAACSRTATTETQNTRENPADSQADGVTLAMLSHECLSATPASCEQADNAQRQ